MSLAKIIFNDRQQRGMTMPDYAKYLSLYTPISTQMINDVEKGRRLFSRTTLEKLQTPLRMNIDTLLWHKGVLPTDVTELDLDDNEINLILYLVRNFHQNKLTD